MDGVTIPTPEEVASLRELPQLVTCDWLQFYCKCQRFNHEEITQVSQFKIKDTERGTRVFQRVYEVYEKARCTSSRRDEKLAVLAMFPYSSVIDRDMVIVKIENRALYHVKLYARIACMLKACHLHYVSITRLDVACDFAIFANGLHPLELLEQYRANRLLKRGSRSYCQWLTAPYTATTAPYQLGDKLAGALHVTHSVSWGGAKADAHVKMYNKSREIRVESHKQYIARYWKTNGLVTSSDIWRVEVSIGGRSRALYDENNGVSLAVSLLEACNPRYLAATFLALVERHFAFLDTDGARTRKEARLLPLWNVATDLKFVAVTATSKPDPTRTTKVCMNYLRKLPDEYDLGYFCKNYGENARNLYGTLKILGDVFEDLRVVTKEREWLLHEYADEKIADCVLLERFGVVVPKSAWERQEDLAVMLETSDKRQKELDGLAAAYWIEKEARGEL